MEMVLEILKYVIPALIVFLTAYLTVRALLRHDQKKREREIILKNKQMITPVRLQAYERLTLFLERISPDNLVMRFSKDNLTVSQLQNQMLKTIRSEFDHNVSQQIYISPRAWEVVKSARENTVKMINTTAQTMRPDEPAIKLSKALLEKIMEQQKSPSRVALDYLKREAGTFF
jgi:heme/copper-type cytochrome/quinol oxidase subunit 2